MENQSGRGSASSEIHQLFAADRKDRVDFAKGASLGLEIRQRDEQRLQKAKEIAARGGISDPQDLNRLAFIFQHGDSVADYRQALGLTTQAVAAGLPPQDSIIPHVTDRLMIQEQLDANIPLHEVKQKFGTQTRFDETGNPFKPKLDGTATQEEFEKFGIEQHEG